MFTDRFTPLDELTFGSFPFLGKSFKNKEKMSGACYRAYLSERYILI